MNNKFNSADCATGCGPASNHPFFGKHSARHFANKFGMRRPKYNVPLNVTEIDTAYNVEVFATGFSKEHITLNVVDDVLYISGSKENVEEKTFSTQEFPIKNFERKLGLNGQIDITTISAKSENGILNITLPKTAEAQKKDHKIEVK